VALIRASGATPTAVAIALDRQEKGAENGIDLPHSAVQYITAQLGLQVCAIATLADLLHYLSVTSDASLTPFRQSVSAYRARYGV
jgi:orotate phosphoribosyltransferase